MAVSKRTRFEVFKRDGFTCQYCGRTPPTVTLECDHVHPRARGGGNQLCNLRTACSDCNLGKSDIPLRHDKAAIDLASRRDYFYGEALAKAFDDGREVGDVPLAGIWMLHGAMHHFGFDGMAEAYLGSIGYVPVTVSDVAAFRDDMNEVVGMEAAT